MTSSQSAHERAYEFLRTSAQFQLGQLPTEAPHEKTRNLSQLCETDLTHAITNFKEVELGGLQALGQRQVEILELTVAIASAFARGSRVILCGCGATGRLSLTLETLWRESCRNDPWKKNLEDRVLSFMAGGDYALVRSIENFEDHPEFGARQLHDIGFTEDDLLISITEGGETPFVIGATEEAAKFARHSPWFLFCNPKEALTVDRSRRILENSKIRSVSIETGPMAIAGSTRLQASSALMLAVGAALFQNFDGTSALQRINDYLRTLAQTDFSGLARLIEIESGVYKQSNRFCLHTSQHHAITVLTDTTERSPTFSMTPFENEFDQNPTPSWTYLSLPQAQNATEAWNRILARAPRPLTWPEISERYGARILNGFDFSNRSNDRRRKLDPNLTRLSVTNASELQIELSIANQTENAAWSFKRPNWIVAEHLLLKCAMNISSTLVMGRLGRFKGNLMLFVKASNNKLVDRAIRFTRILLSEANCRVPSYEQTCLALFEAAESLAPQESIVLKTFDRLRHSS